MLTWRYVLDRLQSLRPDQLDMPVVGLIDAEPWEASKLKIASADDDWRPNQPYLVFD